MICIYEMQEKPTLILDSRVSGRNHHAIGLAAITEAAVGYPSSYGSIPKSAAVAEVLKQNGYNTMALGKWHLTPYTARTPPLFAGMWPGEEA
jgi:arylsulfatase A-like enzyme